jgi:hypothetical protein
MKQAAAFETMIISVLGLTLVWLTLIDPSLPNIPQIPEKGLIPLVFQYTFRTPANAAEEISNRPLFLPTRRPYIQSSDLAIPAISESELVPPALDQVVLLGITIGPNGRTGLVKLTGDTKSRMVREGDALSGWRIDHILKNTIVLSNGSNQRELNFSKNQKSLSKELITLPW